MYLIHFQLKMKKGKKVKEEVRCPLKLPGNVPLSYDIWFLF